ncbi:MAG: hypothetical protein AUH29_06555 [Candidatus Rokubacteria bacterium 13_1_40CM_69_27]|nr:MAG: hypothetical protein AUH29_06555 [Candidatus Rokubacteria bacterium 13_1_40CM_69_27]OLC39833.1 MAG: hypothetical protein AUH81_00360 [Candidatus Rokubacteria bacterium 13_1_40CM_4_69_5]OLE37390.1 MAG: hypothetical protein AUG00_08400 [Candidatus Rokubacteria bacterium 13_1_20CM_2_70_7]
MRLVAIGVLALVAAAPAAAQENRLMDALHREVDPRKRRALWERVQQLFYEDAGRIKFGDYASLEAVRREVKGFVPWLDR